MRGGYSWSLKYVHCGLRDVMRCCVDFLAVVVVGSGAGSVVMATSSWLAIFRSLSDYIGYVSMMEVESKIVLAKIWMMSASGIRKLYSALADWD